MKTKPARSSVLNLVVEALISVENRPGRIRAELLARRAGEDPPVARPLRGRERWFTCVAAVDKGDSPKRVEGRKQDEAFCNADERRRLGGLFACVGSNGGSDRSPIRRQTEKLGEP
jgi:hypothetical protein